MLKDEDLFNPCIFCFQFSLTNHYNIYLPVNYRTLMIDNKIISQVKLQKF